jgi:hypothetical protein
LKNVHCDLNISSLWAEEESYIVRIQRNTMLQCLSRKWLQLSEFGSFGNHVA